MHDKMCFSLGGKWPFIIFPPTLSVVLVMGCCPGNGAVVLVTGAVVLVMGALSVVNGATGLWRGLVLEGLWWLSADWWMD